MPALTDLVPRGALRSLPPGVRTVVREQRRRRLGEAGGRVLDLSGDPEHRPLYPPTATVVAGRDAAGADAAFDTVVSVLHLAAAADPVAEVERAHRLLAADGALLFLEPAPDTGLGRRGQHLVAPVVGRVAGWRPDRDVPALLRHAGFVIADLRRVDLPRRVWPLTGLIVGRAVHRATRP